MPRVYRFDAEAYLLLHGPALGATAAAAAEANGTGPSAAAVVKIHMAGDDDEANEKARREAELQEKRAQNALPSWIAQSTISSADPEHGNGAGGGGGGASSSSRAAGEADDDDAEVVSGQMSSSAAAGGATLRLGDERKPSLLQHQRYAPGSDEPTAADGDASLDAYYASLAALEEGGGTSGIDSTSSGTPGVAAAASAAVESPLLLSSSATPARGASEEQPLESSAAAAVVGDSSRLKRERDEDEEGDEDFEGVSKRSRSSVVYSTAAAASEGVDSPALSLEEGASSSFGAGTPDVQQPTEPDATAADAAASLAGAGEGGEEEEEDEVDDDEFDEFDEFEPAEGGNADPNQLVTVNGKEMPFSEVTDDMTGEMVRPFLPPGSKCPLCSSRKTNRTLFISVPSVSRPRTSTA